MGDYRIREIQVTKYVVEDPQGRRISGFSSTKGGAYAALARMKTSGEIPADATVRSS